MAVDATGAPTSPDNIPTYNTGADAPSGKGFNAAMAALQTALSARLSGQGTPAGGNIPVWNAGASKWQLDGTTKAAVSGLVAGNSGDVLQTSGGIPAWASGAVVLNRATASVDINTSVAETDFYNFSVPGNTIGATKMLRLTIFGDYLHNNVAGDTANIRLYFGGTKHYDFSHNFAGVIAATRQPWFATICIANLNATNSQAIFGSFINADANNAAPTTGIGVLNAGRGGQIGITTLGVIDTTAAAVVRLSAQWSASSVNNSFRSRYAVLELV
jgi:hypothetical protein